MKTPPSRGVTERETLDNPQRDHQELLNHPMSLFGTFWHFLAPNDTLSWRARWLVELVESGWWMEHRDRRNGEARCSPTGDQSRGGLI